MTRFSFPRFHLLPWALAIMLWCLPALAMRFTHEVNWTGLDFLVMGSLLAAACLAYEMGACLSSAATYRAGIAIAVLAAFLMVWINLAVGIIGSEDNFQNLIFFAVPAAGLVGAALVRGHPSPLSWILRAMGAFELILALGSAAVGERPACVMSALTGVAWIFSAHLVSRSLAAKPSSSGASFKC